MIDDLDEYGLSAKEPMKEVATAIGDLNALNPAFHGVPARPTVPRDHLMAVVSNWIQPGSTEKVIVQPRAIWINKRIFASTAPFDTLAAVYLVLSVNGHPIWTTQYRASSLSCLVDFRVRPAEHIEVAITNNGNAPTRWYGSLVGDVIL